ncbi:MAG: hypothetical protein J6B29_00220 [Clostridia bacterium]|nr:hypothetical protein [Clostridia bacterium]
MDEERELRATKAKTVIKAILTVSLFIFIGALVFRMCQASHKELEDTVISDGLKSAYAVSQDVRTHAVNDEFSENGAVYGYSLIYIEEAGYLQFTVRYNTRHIEEVKLSYPELEEEDIFYELTDGEGTTYSATVLCDTDKYNYRYFKLEFTNVSFSTQELKVRMVLGDININVGDKSTLTVHRQDDTYIPYTFTAQEKKELEG